MFAEWVCSWDSSYNSTEYHLYSKKFQFQIYFRINYFSWLHSAMMTWKLRLGNGGLMMITSQKTAGRTRLPRDGTWGTQMQGAALLRKWKANEWTHTVPANPICRPGSCLWWKTGLEFGSPALLEWSNKTVQKVQTQGPSCWEKNTSENRCVRGVVGWGSQ